ncbi:MAG: DUF1015 family protein [Methanoregulaceae archaeon]|nr:DUF1015 family protein [Methanoregulaceae archaeon]
MVRIFPFAAVRPDPLFAAGIASVPYDVVTAEEARASIGENPQSFLRVSRADAELPDLRPDDPQVYERARSRFQEMLAGGLMQKDRSPGFYLYRVIQDGAKFHGLCCCLDVRDYEEGHIRKHELTRYDKEADRTRHIETVNAHTGPVVLLYKDRDEIGAVIRSLDRSGTPISEVCVAPGVVHQVFRVEDQETVLKLSTLFAGVERVYIADGHHRAKSAANVAARRQAAGTAGAETGRFMGVIFPAGEVKIHGYSRLVTDLGPYSSDEFIGELQRIFSIRPHGPIDPEAFQIVPEDHGSGRRVFHMYLEAAWYECSFPPPASGDLIASLDVSVLQSKVLSGLLGISDPRGDPRLQYLGGARPLSDLEALVDGGKFRAAFAMQPVHVDTVTGIADAGGIMPPKSTWFEPKLLSGLLVHTLD